MEVGSLDTASIGAFLASLALAIALAACAGLRAWLPLLLTGALARGGYLTLGPSFQFLASNQALLLFGAATLIEVAGDKIPAIDHTLDALSTLLRPAAGALLAASVFWQISDPLSALALGAAVGAPTALVPHAAKSAFRVLATGLTAGLANPVVSLLEDVLTLVAFALAVLVPIAVALGMLLVVLLLARRRSRRPFPAVRTA
jgi:hypothetical protein